MGRSNPAHSAIKTPVNVPGFLMHTNLTTLRIGIALYSSTLPSRPNYQEIGWKP